VKPIFRRASTTIIIFSFIFPWIKLKIPFASDIYGFTLIKYLLKIGFHIRRGELTFLALIALMILLFALFTLLLPSLIPTVITISFGLFFLFLLYMFHEVITVQYSGIIVLSFGIFSLIFTMFLPEEREINQKETILKRLGITPEMEIAKYIEYHHIETKECPSCHKQLLKYQKTCPYCQAHTN